MTFSLQDSNMQRYEHATLYRDDTGQISGDSGIKQLKTSSEHLIIVLSLHPQQPWGHL